MLAPHCAGCGTSRAPLLAPRHPVRRALPEHLAVFAQLATSRHEAVYDPGPATCRRVRFPFLGPAPECILGRGGVRIQAPAGSSAKTPEMVEPVLFLWSPRVECAGMKDDTGHQSSTELHSTGVHGQTRILPASRALEMELEFAQQDYMRVSQQQSWIRFFPWA